MNNTNNCNDSTMGAGSSPVRQTASPRRRRDGEDTVLMDVLIYNHTNRLLQHSHQRLDGDEPASFWRSPAGAVREEETRSEEASLLSSSQAQDPNNSSSSSSAVDPIRMHQMHQTARRLWSLDTLVPYGDASRPASITRSLTDILQEAIEISSSELTLLGDGQESSTEGGNQEHQQH